MLEILMRRYLINTWSDRFKKNPTPFYFDYCDNSLHQPINEYELRIKESLDKFVSGNANEVLVKEEIDNLVESIVDSVNEEFLKSKVNKGDSLDRLYWKIAAKHFGYKGFPSKGLDSLSTYSKVGLLVNNSMCFYNALLALHCNKPTIFRKRRSYERS